MDTERELFAYLQGKTIYLYGAGQYARKLWERLEKNKICVQGYLVTEQSGNPSEINHKKVRTLENILESGPDLSESTIVVAMARGQLEVLDYLLEHGLKNVVLVNQRIWQDIREQERSEREKREGEEKARERKGGYRETRQGYVLDRDYPFMEPNHGAIADGKTGDALFRMPLYGNTEKEPDLNRECRMEVFESLYGPYHKLPYGDGKPVNAAPAGQNEIEIYAMTTHRNRIPGESGSEGVILLQVGAALTPLRMGYLTDDTGDHISGENPNYCECTGLYWIWKNTCGQKYLGLNHYRRRFRWDEESVRYMTEQDVDAVAVLPQFLPGAVAEYFSGFVSRHDWKFMKEAVIKYDPAYGRLFEQYEQSHFFIPCNMVLFKRAWFDLYCEFAFSVAAEIDGRYKQMRVIRQDRYMGYLFENLLSLFLMRHHESMKIAYTDMYFIK